MEEGIDIGIVEVAEESMGVGYKEVVIETDEKTVDKTEIGDKTEVEENVKEEYEDVDRLI